MTGQTNTKKSGLFLYLLLLTSLFVLLEISFLIQGSAFYLGDFRFISSHLTIPIRVLPGIIYFLFAQILVHLGFVTFIWSLSCSIGHAFKLSWKKTEKLGLVLWFIGLLTVLLANQCLFPNSAFAELSQLIFPTLVAKILLIAFLIILSVSILCALYGLFLMLSSHYKIALSLLSITLILVFSFYPQEKISPNPATAERPNIILIGLDALRPDFLSYFDNNKKTPHLDQFLDQATVFSTAMTPIARTYPAWISLLTGSYPKKNGVRLDLEKQMSFNLQETLPAILQQQGYETLFATDETRFSNIRRRVGFNQIISPPAGFNDFLLGTFNDFPMSNLLINTLIGRYLFPHSYGNRSVFITYEPNSFLNLLKSVLEKPQHKPIFLAAHFCLPHYPYLWADFSGSQNPVENYQAAVARTDQLFNDFYLMLEKNKLLKHAIVIVLSDHGEAFELSGDRMTNPNLFIPGIKNTKDIIPRFYPPSADSEKVDQSAGHGTDVLSWTQYHNVFAMRLFGLKQQKPGIISSRVSLLDIKPTLLNLLKINPVNPDGKSLVDLLFKNKLTPSPQQDFFIESDYSPTAVHSVHPETRQVLFEGINQYQIDPKTTRISVKDSMVSLVISSKQYADFYGPWVLALYPQNTKLMMPILVNLNSGLWTNDLTVPFAQQSPVKHMLNALKAFYGNDITAISSVPS